MGADDALCLDRGLVDFGFGHRFRHAKVEVLKDRFLRRTLCKNSDTLCFYLWRRALIKGNCRIRKLENQRNPLIQADILNHFQRKHPCTFSSPLSSIFLSLILILSFLRILIDLLSKSEPGCLPSIQRSW